MKSTIFKMKIKCRMIDLMWHFNFSLTFFGKHVILVILMKIQSIYMNV